MSARMAPTAVMAAAKAATATTPWMSFFAMVVTK